MQIPGLLPILMGETATEAAIRIMPQDIGEAAESLGGDTAVPNDRATTQKVWQLRV
ncbi:MAG: hypothetical protein P8173_17260 [Gammaproteobacteria bacterium]